jgi:hypothetical protein
MLLAFTPAAVPFMNINGEIEDRALIVLAKNLDSQQMSGLGAAKRARQVLRALSIAHATGIGQKSPPDNTC